MRVRTTLLAVLVVGCVVLIADSAFAAGPIHHWSKNFGDSEGQYSSSMTLDASGNVILAGYFWGVVDFGGGPLVSAGASDIFIAKFAPNGAHVWSRRYGGTTDEQAYSVAVSSSGSVTIVGNFGPTVDLGGGTLTGPAGFVASYDASGAHLWSKAFIAAGCTSNAVDASDNVVVGGEFSGSVDFGGGPIAAIAPVDGFVAEFDASGAHLWSKGIGGSSYSGVNDVGVDVGGNVIAVGRFSGTNDFGGGATAALGLDVFVVKYDPSGAYAWDNTYGTPSGYVYAYGMAIDGSGNPVVTGYCTGPVDFGGGTLPGTGQNIFVVSLDPSGAHRWSHRFGDASGYQIAYGVAANASGDVAITGNFVNTANFGGGTLTSFGDDIFVAKFDTYGVHRWSQHFGPGGYGQAVAVDAAGDVYATGDMYAPIDFGGGTLTNDGEDIFLAKYGEEEPIPVAITRFDALTVDAGVEVRWELRSDEAIDALTIYRGENGAAPLSIVELSDARTRSFVDRSVKPGTRYQYELLVRTLDGGEFRSPIASATTHSVTLALGQNHPNPFNPETTIDYSLSKHARVVVGIYDTAGALVARLDDGEHDAGNYHVEWNGRDTAGHAVGSGVYFYRLEGAPAATSKKMVLLK